MIKRISDKLLTSKLIPSVKSFDGKKSDYTFGKVAGEGGLGIVFKGKDKASGGKVAIKAMKKK